MPQITRKISGAGDCQGKNCPAVWETDDPQTVGIQGTTATAASLVAAGAMPPDESIVFVPASLLAELASGQR